MLKTHYDVVIVGSGHNGLVAAAYLGGAGLSVLVLEANDYIGGATTSKRIFPDHDALLSRYSYLVSLFPTKIKDDLGLSFSTRRREVASFTPYVDSVGVDRGLVLSNVDTLRSQQSMEQLCGGTGAWKQYQRFLELETAIAKMAWPSMLQPLRSREMFKSSLPDAEARAAWTSFVEAPLGDAIESHIDHDLLRGVLFTDAKIGVLTHPHDESLLQNRCFLYHVIGQGTGEWQVPVGGMKSLVDSLVNCGTKNRVEYQIQSPVKRLIPGSKFQTIEFEVDGVLKHVDATHVLMNAAPSTLARLVGRPWQPQANDEGSVVKVNMLLKRLPTLKAVGVTSQEGFAGSLHINEGYDQMRQSYSEAVAGNLPSRPPYELYCHTLTDPSILSADLHAQGFQTLTLFGLDVPYRAFRTNHDERKHAILQCYLDGLNQICGESFESCLAQASDGSPCIEIKTPQELELEVGLDQGNIFHNAPSWFFTDDKNQTGRWGVETEFEQILVAGSSAARGGAVSGIPGHNAAMCVFEKLGIQQPA